MGVRLQLNTAATNKIAFSALIHWATAQIIIYLLHGQQSGSLNTLQLSAHGVAGAGVGAGLYATGGEGGPASVAVLQARTLLWFAAPHCVKNTTSGMTPATEPPQVPQPALVKLTIPCSSPTLQRFSPTWFICRKGGSWFVQAWSRGR